MASMDDDNWTEWFRTTLVTNGGLKEIRKPTLKRTAHPLLRDGSIEWLRIEVATEIESRPRTSQRKSGHGSQLAFACWLSSPHLDRHKPP